MEHGSPGATRRAARVWLGYRFGLWFAFQTSATATMVFLITDLHLNPLELTLVGTTLELTVALAEIPTGVVADTISRKLSIIIGVALLGVGFLIYAVPIYWVVLLAQVVWAIGYTFTSGADVAWITDEVGEERARPLYLRGAQAKQAAVFAGIVCGGAIGAYNLQLAIVTGALLQFCVAVWLWIAMPETGFQRPPPEEREAHHIAFATTFKGATKVVRGHRTLKITFLVMALMGLASEGFDRLWELHVIKGIGVPAWGDFPPIVWIAGLQAIALICAVLLTELARRRLDLDSDHGVERAAFLVVAGMVVSVVCFGLTNSFWTAAALLWVVAAMWEVSDPVLAAWINRDLDSATRATVNSLASQADGIGQVAGGPLWGGLALLVSVPAALVGAGLAQVPTLVVLGRRRRAHQDEAQQAQQRGAGERSLVDTGDGDEDAERERAEPLAHVEEQGEGGHRVAPLGLGRTLDDDGEQRRIEQ
jgi:DHA3 family tetracycline resistance protein-like MFS transporter